MNRIDRIFAGLRRQNQKALIAYLTVGFPRISLLPKLVSAIAEGGADLIELGIPFSDPLADGPTIQRASQWALRQGVTPRVVLQQVRDLRRRGIEIPLALMTYLNPVFHYGIGNFCRDAAQAGADGLIVPDLPPEEAGELKWAARSHRLQTIFLASPTSSKERLRRIVEASAGFVYYVSLTGVTGARSRLPRQIATDVTAIQRLTELPVCVGFGISSSAQVREIVRVADGAIVGSRLLEVIEGSGSPAERANLFIRQLKEGCHA